MHCSSTETSVGRGEGRQSWLGTEWGSEDLLCLWRCSSFNFGEMASEQTNKTEGYHLGRGLGRSLSAKLGSVP